MPILVGFHQLEPKNSSTKTLSGPGKHGICNDLPKWPREDVSKSMSKLSLSKKSLNLPCSKSDPQNWWVFWRKKNTEFCGVFAAFWSSSGVGSPVMRHWLKRCTTALGSFCAIMASSNMAEPSPVSASPDMAKVARRRSQVEDHRWEKKMLQRIDLICRNTWSL